MALKAMVSPASKRGRADDPKTTSIAASVTSNAASRVAVVITRAVGAPAVTEIARSGGMVMMVPGLVSVEWSRTGISI